MDMSAGGPPTDATTPPPPGGDGPPAPGATPPPSPLRWPSDATAPTADDTDLSTFTALSPEVMVLWRLAYAIVAAVVLAVVAVVVGINDTWPVALRALPVLVVAAVAVTAVVVVPRAEYRRWRYLVTDDGIELRHGLVIHHESSIPHFRVQHVDVRQGVLQRSLGIVSLSISTASPATDAELPGVAPARAEAIRARVLERAEADDGV